MKLDMSDEEEYRNPDEEFEDINDSNNMHLQINREGNAEIYDPITVDKKDFQKLQMGLIMLRNKYPEISRECFPDKNKRK